MKVFIPTGRNLLVKGSAYVRMDEYYEIWESTVYDTDGYPVEDFSYSVIISQHTDGWSHQTILNGVELKHITNGQVIGKRNPAK